MEQAGSSGQYHGLFREEVGFLMQNCVLVMAFVRDEHFLSFDTPVVF